jgi:cytochrome c
MMKSRFALAVLALSATGFGFMSGASAQDAANGEKVFNKCKACHTLEAGKNKIGPSLQGVIGRPAGALEGFKFSDAMKAAGTGGMVWDEQTMDQYLAKPKEFITGNKMPFPGLPKPEDRADVIAYIKSQMK